MTPDRGSKAFPVIQIVAVAATLLLGWAFPARRGTVLLIAPLGASQAELIDHAVAARARVARRGPFGGTLLVKGDRDRLFAAMLPFGVIPVRAPDIICGKESDGGTA